MKTATARFSALCWSVAVIGLSSSCTSLQLPDRALVYQEVFYLTVRKESESEKLSKRYTGDRGPPSYGVAMVALDPDEAFTPNAQPQQNWILQQEEQLHSDDIQQVVKESKSQFLDQVQNYPNDSQQDKDVLLYLHGYKKDFSDSLTNAAKLRHELAFSGPVIAFSWPSNNTFSGYPSDVENIDWSEPYLRQLILALAESLPGAKIHIIAHSLGNRALIGSFIQLEHEPTIRKDWPLGEIVFMAPDLDKEHFVEETSKRLSWIPSRMTLYVSARDIPLMTAGSVFQYPRLGDSREGPPIINGIETVDVSDAINITSGHGYYEESSIAIEDLYHLIREGKSASDRPNLREVNLKDGVYWRLQPIPGKTN